MKPPPNFKENSCAHNNNMHLEDGYGYDVVLTGK